MKWFLTIIFGWFLLNSIGCQLPGSRLENALADAGKQLSEKIKNEGLMDKFLVDADGHVQDPGLETSVNVEISARVRAIGINGNIVTSMSGNGSKISSELKNELVNELAQPNLPQDRRDAILTILTWNRTQPPK